MRPLKPHFLILFMIVLFIGLTIYPCEVPIELQAPQEEQGTSVHAGTAGSDGSVIHAGQGRSDEATGKAGDFYLDLATSNLYGQKNGKAEEIQSISWGRKRVRVPPIRRILTMGVGMRRLIADCDSVTSGISEIITIFCTVSGSQRNCGLIGGYTVSQRDGRIIENGFT